jgi:hypothetical protein
VDSESLAAAGLLAALSRASKILAELRHPLVRSEGFSYFFPDAGARIGTTFTLPEVRFEVSITVSAAAFQVEGSITAENDPLLELPRKSLPRISDGLAAFDDYVGEVAAPATRLIEQLLDEIV